MAPAGAAFREWSQRWIALADYRGRFVPDVDQRIEGVAVLWDEPVPPGWERGRDPRVLDRYRRYTRGNGGPADVRRGEHVIEYDILAPSPKDTATAYAGGRLVDGVNAVPLSRDLGGGRTGNVEADMLLLVEREGSYEMLLVEAKRDAQTAWYAVVENLRQMKLFTAGTTARRLFHARRADLKLPDAVPATAVVLAPEDFYTAPGAKSAAVEPAEELLDRMRAAAGIDACLATWDPRERVIARRGPDA